MRLDPQLIHGLCIAVGWKGDEAILATCMALASSGGDPEAQMPTTADDSVTYRGLFGLSVRSSDEENRMGWFDYRRNAREAYRRWEKNGKTWVGHVQWPIVDLDARMDDCREMLGLTYV